MSRYFHKFSTIVVWEKKANSVENITTDIGLKTTKVQGNISLEDQQQQQRQGAWLCAKFPDHGENKKVIFFQLATIRQRQLRQTVFFFFYISSFVAMVWKDLTNIP